MRAPVSFPVRFARGVLPAVTVAAALLVVVPGLDAPFSTPKRWVLMVGAVVALASLPWSRRRLAWPLALVPLTALFTLPLAIGTSPEALWRWLAFGGLAFAWASSGVDARWLGPSAVGSGIVVALVALAQAVGIDPFAALAPQASGERLRVYATLGNPDFVASALTVVLCLALGMAAESKKPRRWLAGAAVVLLGLAVTRSFATVASLGAALMAVAVHVRRRRARAATEVRALAGNRDHLAASTDATRSRTMADSPTAKHEAPATESSGDWPTTSRPSSGDSPGPSSPSVMSRSPTSAERSASTERSVSYESRDEPPGLVDASDVAERDDAIAHSVTAARDGRGGRPARDRTLAFAAVLAITALLVPLAGRSLPGAADGRLYLARVIAPHAFDAPLAGLGPGAVEALWPMWEVEWWRARCGQDAACVAADPHSRFAALQDHAHDDWLEVLVERGLAGLGALFVLFAAALRRAWRSPRPLASAVLASLVGVMTRAALDFPLARSADLCLLAGVVGLAFSLEDS